MQEAEQSVLMTVKETADHLRVSERTIRRWIKENVLTSIRVGKTCRIVRDSLPTFVISEKNFGKSCNFVSGMSTIVH